MKLVVPGVYTFTGLYIGRVYLLEGQNGFTLIDTGIPAAGSKILRQLERAGHQPDAITRIFITHAHPDHVGSLTLLKQATGAPIYLGEADRDLLNPDHPIPDHTLTEGDVFPDILDGLHVLHTPGHSFGHVSFWQPDRRILFCGDVIMRFPQGLTLPFANYTPDMNLDKQSIQKLAALQPEVVCFGHGFPLKQNAAATVQAFANRNRPN